MSKRLFAAAAVAASVIVAPVVADQPIAASSNQIEIWSNYSDSQNASKYWMPTGTNFKQPRNYNSPDYRNGQAYIRIQVTSKPTNARMQPRVCFWRHEGTKRFKYETCANTAGYSFTSKGVMYMKLGSPGNWWKKNGVWDWSKPADVGRIMLSKPRGKLFLDSNCGKACYDGPGKAAAHLPVAMTSTMIFVPKGQKLTKPANWKDCPAAVCG